MTATLSLVSLFVVGLFVSANGKLKERFKSLVFSVTWMCLACYFLWVSLDWQMSISTSKTYYLVTWSCYGISLIHTLRYIFMNKDA